MRGDTESTVSASSSMLLCPSSGLGCQSLDEVKMVAA